MLTPDDVRRNGYPSTRQVARRWRLPESHIMVRIDSGQGEVPENQVEAR